MGGGERERKKGEAGGGGGGSFGRGRSGVKTAAASFQERKKNFPWRSRIEEEGGPSSPSDRVFPFCLV